MQGIHSTLRAVALRTLGVLALVSLTSIASAQTADVGLVNMLNGDVTYASAGASGSKVQSFMKIRQGDRFTVPAGAQLRIVYFDGGRQETWKGPAAFQAGAKSSSASSGSPAQVATLPSTVPQRIAQVPELLQIAKLGRSGGVAVRDLKGEAPRLSAEQQAEVDAAKETYKKMRAQSSADDILPELYLYSVLQDNLLYDDMKPVVAEMSKRQPGNSEIEALASWVASRAK